jgi:hypothetical protein
MSKPLDLEPIRARLAAATPGPWEAEHRGFEVYETHTAHGDLVAEASLQISDAELIAHAPADLAALADEVESLRRELARQAAQITAVRVVSAEWWRLAPDTYWGSKARAAILAALDGTS